jgi:phage terminase large subunit-like protein
MLQFGLRLGEDPRVLVTTTPRPVPHLRALAGDGRTAVRRIATSDNAAIFRPALSRRWPTATAVRGWAGRNWTAS